MGSMVSLAEVILGNRMKSADLKKQSKTLMLQVLLFEGGNPVMKSRVIWDQEQ